MPAGGESALVLDYASPVPRPRRLAIIAAHLWRHLSRLASWSWLNLHHIAGVTGCVVSVSTVWFLFHLRVRWAVPVFGGCGASRAGMREELLSTGLVLLIVPILWFLARRSGWPVRLLRSSFLIGVAAWLYVCWAMGRPGPPWHW